jgi:hypothetical protein
VFNATLYTTQHALNTQRKERFNSLHINNSLL